MLLSSVAPRVAAPATPAPHAPAPAAAPAALVAFQYAHKTAANTDGSSNLTMGVVMPNPFQPGAEPFRVSMDGVKPAGSTDAKTAAQRMFDPKDPAQVAALASFTTALEQAQDGLKGITSNVDPTLMSDKVKASAWMDAAAPDAVLVSLSLADGTKLDWGGTWAAAPAPLAAVLQAYDAAGKTFTVQAPKG